MATRNQTILFKKHRDALKSVRAPTTSSTHNSIELAATSLIRRSYAPLSTDDFAASSRLVCQFLVSLFAFLFFCWIYIVEFKDHKLLLLLILFEIIDLMICEGNIGIIWQ
ncbi:hypothetical protein RND81_04G195900 [Saponaria officinalis]|uniref:Transmembrane protein n=1 Tax=Saponaria officinalis TaxID=3572 RepID=A0AAW1LML2_SAPOF